MPTDVPITASDTLALSDDVAIDWGVERSATDAISLSDAILFTAGIPQNSLADQIILTDSIQVINAIGLVESGLVQIAVPQVTGSLGDSVSVDITLTVLGNARPTAAQWELRYAPDNLTLDSAVIGAAGTAAGKILTQGGTPGAETFMLYGLNETAIATGIVATLNFTIPLTAISNPTLLQILGLAVATVDNQTITGITDDTVLFSDTLSFSDAIQVILDLAVDVNDSLSLSDSIDVSGDGILNIEISVSDALSFSDSILFTQSQQSGSNFISYLRRYLNDVI